MMRPGVLLAVILSVLAVSGCATPYKPKGATGGFSDTRLDAGTFRVEFQGNQYTSRDVVDAYLLYRCAELTRATGYDYFVIEEYVGRPEIFATQYIVENESGTSREVVYSGRYGAGAVIKVMKGEKPKASAIQFDPNEAIMVIRGEKGGRSRPPYDAFDAKEVMRSLEARVKR